HAAGRVREPALTGQGPRASRRQVPRARQRGGGVGGDGAGARGPAPELDALARAQRRRDHVVQGHAEVHAVRTWGRLAEPGAAMADQPFPYSFLAVLLLPWLVRALASRRPPGPSGSDKAEAALIEAGDLVLMGRLDEAFQSLQVAAPLIDKLPELMKHEPLARLHLLEGLIAVAQGKTADADASFRAVRTLVPVIGSRKAAAALEARVEAESMRLVDDIEAFRAHGEKALVLEPEVHDADTLGCLAWSAVRLGRVEQGAGKWERARHLWQEAIRIAERIPV